MAKIYFRTHPDKNFDEIGKDVGIDDGLDLTGVSGGDVGHGPSGFLHDVHPGVFEQVVKDREGSGGQDGVGLAVASGHDVAESPERGGHHLEVTASQPAHERADDPGVHDLLDLFVGAVGEVREGPAGVG